MKWVQGHNPDLVVTNKDGSEKERLDLTQYTYDEIHDLLQNKGFRRKQEL